LVGAFVGGAVELAASDTINMNKAAMATTFLNIILQFASVVLVSCCVGLYFLIIPFHDRSMPIVGTATRGVN
jgi:hypothetical protein